MATAIITTDPGPADRYGCAGEALAGLGVAALGGLAWSAGSTTPVGSALLVRALTRADLAGSGHALLGGPTSLAALAAVLDVAGQTSADPVATGSRCAGRTALLGHGSVWLGPVANDGAGIKPAVSLAAGADGHYDEVAAVGLERSAELARPESCAVLVESGGPDDERARVTVILAKIEDERGDGGEHTHHRRGIVRTELNLDRAHVARVDPAQLDVDLRLDGTALARILLAARTAEKADQR
jgi:hypothetical protein